MTRKEELRRVAECLALSAQNYDHIELADMILTSLLQVEREALEWTRRMVKKYMKSIDGLRVDLHPDFVCGYMQAGHEFLALLDQRRK